MALLMAELTDLARTLDEWIKRQRLTVASLSRLADLSRRTLYNIQDVAKQLGHTVETCQRTYAHFLGDGLRRAAKALGKALRNRLSGPKRANGSRNGTRTGG